VTGNIKKHKSVNLFGQRILSGTATLSDRRIFRRRSWGVRSRNILLTGEKPTGFFPFEDSTSASEKILRATGYGNSQGLWGEAREHLPSGRPELILLLIIRELNRKLVRRGNSMKLVLEMDFFWLGRGGSRMFLAAWRLNICCRGRGNRNAGGWQMERGKASC
jgi:hypothetical protein